MHRLSQKNRHVSVPRQSKKCNGLSTGPRFVRLAPMVRRGRLPLVVLLLVVGAALAPASQGTRARRPPSGNIVRVASDAGFARAVRRLSVSGGTIVLRPQLYRSLVVPPRRSTRLLRIVGTRGARVQSFLFDGTQNVSLGKIRVGPIYDDAVVEVRAPRRIALHALPVGARGPRHSAGVLIPDSWGV